MIEAYSTNITALAESALPFNNITIQKGCSAELATPATIQFNKRGVYSIHVDGTASPSATGDLTIQLSKNGVLQPQAISSATVETGNLGNVSFETLVQVPQDNTCCCSTSPTTVQVINSIAADYDIIHVCVTKIC